MTDDFISQTIQAAVTAQSEPAAVPESVEIPNTIEATDETSQQEPVEAVDEPFPKKAVNLIDKRNKQLTKARAETYALEAELHKYREAERAQKEKPLDEATFEGNYGDFLKEQAIREYEQKQTDTKHQQEESIKSKAEDEWVAERSHHLDAKAKEALSKIPDYAQVFQDNADVMESMNPDIGRAFLEIDEPALAFYALAKEGRLEDVLSMSPFKAAMEIARAEMRGISMTTIKLASKAPTPITGVRGGGSGGGKINPTDYQALMKGLNLK